MSIDPTRRKTAKRRPKGHPFPGCPKHAPDPLTVSEWTSDVATIRQWLKKRIGYGNLSAPYWLIGLEEGCGKLSKELRIRLEGKYVEDLADAHARLPATHWRLFGKKTPALQATWNRPMLSVLAASGVASPTLQARRDYQATQLGRHDGETLLAELYPLPSQCRRCWPYTTLQDLPGLEHLATRDTYHSAVRAARVELLREAILKHRPSVVIAYGKEAWHRYEEIFAPAAFVDRFDKWCLTSEPRFGGTRPIVVLAPHPGDHESTNEHWLRLGRWLRSARKRSGR